MMDDTFADESGIPFLSSNDDIPVHSTPIKGANVPLPSTRHVLKKMVKKTLQTQDVTASESIQAIQLSDTQAHAREPVSQQPYKGQGHPPGRAFSVERDFHYDRNEGQHRYKTREDLKQISERDNLRPKPRDYTNRYDYPVLNNRGELDMVPDAGNTGKGSTIPVYQPASTIPASGIPVYQSLTGIPVPDKHTHSQDQEHVNGQALTKSETDHKGHSGAVTPTNKTVTKDGQQFSIDSNNSAYSSYANRTKTSSIYKPLEVEGAGVENNSPGSPERQLRVETLTRISGDYADESISVERKRTTIGSPRLSRQQDGYSSKSTSVIKPNNSFCELENSTLHKQRQEIQLLMWELKDRDRELSDMVKAHQQQLTAWEQDRYRLTSTEKKCSKYDDEIQHKSNQLQQALTNMKTLKAKEATYRKELQTARSLLDTLQSENRKLHGQLDQEKSTVQHLKDTVQTVSTKVGKLEAREEELTTGLKLKERDIAAATGQMRDLGERLKQLDWRCKECQDREKEALKEKEDWKRKHEKSEVERKSMSDELAASRAEVSRLSEENRSARQQLALLQKEISMREKCKDELIDSLKIKQERTDSQLRNIRELYERQLKEVAALQQQVETSKEMIRHQQNSLDEQQLSGSYQSRGNSHMSDLSMEKSTASQRSSHSTRTKLSPVHSAKHREPDYDMQSSNHQSSGYQSQLSENQTGLVLGSQQLNLHNVSDTQSIIATKQNQHMNKTSGYGEDSVKFKVPARPDTVPKNVHFSSESSERDNIKKRLEFSEMSSIENYANNKVHRQGHKVHSKASESIDNSDSSKLQSSGVTSTVLNYSESDKASLQSPPRHKGFVIEKTQVELYQDQTGPGVSNRVSPLRETNRDTVKVTEMQREVTETERENTLLNTSLSREDREQCAKEMEEKYVFENKLRSFLEDIEDIDDSIWEDKTNRSVNVLTAEGSPASKLQKLLLESRLMIENLEKSSESPQHTPRQKSSSSPRQIAETSEQKDKQRDET